MISISWGRGSSRNSSCSITSWKLCCVNLSAILNRSLQVWVLNLAVIGQNIAWSELWLVNVTCKRECQQMLWFRDSCSGPAASSGTHSKHPANSRVLASDWSILCILCCDWSVCYTPESLLTEEDKLLVRVSEHCSLPRWCWRCSRSLSRCPWRSHQHLWWWPQSVKQK